MYAPEHVPGPCPAGDTTSHLPTDATRPPSVTGFPGYAGSASRCIVSIHRHHGAEGGDVLEFAILGLLHQSPMHGYELRKQLAQVLGGLRSISYGSLYPALKRMHAAGLISTDEPDPRALLPADAPPLTGRRGKVVYTITAEGKERFHELVQ